MSFAALIAWLLTAGLGLYMFAIWLIEDDGSDDGHSYRRLRAPVVFSHAGLALAGLVVWFISIYVPLNILGDTAVVILAVVAALGVFMFTRWIPVHRMYSGRLVPELGSAPPERNFPLPVVLLHGVLALTTVTLVVIAMIAP
jgi:manganese efflux pump family protein